MGDSKEKNKERRKKKAYDVPRFPLFPAHPLPLDNNMAGTTRVSVRIRLGLARSGLG